MSSSDSSLDRLMLLRFILARFLICSVSPVSWSCAAVAGLGLVGVVAATVAGLVGECVIWSGICLLLLSVGCSPVGVSRSRDLLRALRLGVRALVVLGLFPVVSGLVDMSR